MTRVVFGVLICLATVEVIGLQVFRENYLMSRFEPVSRVEFDRLGRDAALARPTDSAYYRAVLPDSVEGVQEILRWTMNQVTAAAPPGVSVRSAKRAHEIAAAGGGLLCAQMALIFQDALAARGIPSRRLQLLRTLFSRPDTHVTVEVLEDGQWIIYDPTFHVSFRKGQRLVGASDMHASVLDGTVGGIQPVFHGAVAYPVRLETYYMHWAPLYNNVLLRDMGTPTLWAQLPPFRYWWGPRWYYIADDRDGPNWHVKVANELYFLFVAVLPITGFILSLGLAATLLAKLVRGRFSGRGWLSPGA